MRSRIAMSLFVASAALVFSAGCAAKTASVAPPSPQPLGGRATSANPQPATTPTAPAESGAVKVEKPVPPETNPPGDIPDNQAFVAYKTTGGVTVKVPEGWSRQDSASKVLFTDKLNTIILSWAPAATAPSVASFKSTDVPQLAKSQPAFEFKNVTAVKLPAGPGIHAVYRINSTPNAVTGKKYRLDVEQYTLFSNGKRADLMLLSPVGSDNVDPWRIVSESLTWK